MSRFRAFAFAAVVATTSVAGLADLSPKFSEWFSGPVQWLVTSDEQRAWRDVKSDDQAQTFIDLFWARRDPTPGTPVNEFRNEFDARVIAADQAFKERAKRGALTDPGRVYIVIGPPKSSASMSSVQASGVVTAPTAGAGGRGIATLRFEYDHPTALGLSGPVAFAENLRTHEMKLDFQSGNVRGALDLALQRAIVNPGLKEVPDWARTPLTRAPDPTAENESAAATTTAPRAAPEPPAPVMPRASGVAGAAGAHDLMLLANARAIKVGEDKPFDGAVAKSSFRKNEDLGFAFQYCTTAVGSSKPKLVMSVTMSATIAGAPVSVSTPEDEVTAETIRILPGCYLVRGAIPLESLEPGSYRFTVTVTDGATGRSYNLHRDFRLE